jgi:hypothetical protein
MLNEGGKFSSIAYGSSEAAIVVHWLRAGNVEKVRGAKGLLGLESWKVFKYSIAWWSSVKGQRILP